MWIVGGAMRQRRSRLSPNEINHTQQELQKGQYLVNFEDFGGIRGAEAVSSIFNAQSLANSSGFLNANNSGCFAINDSY